MDLYEWEIKITSNKCPYMMYINEFHHFSKEMYVKKSKRTNQCNHPDNVFLICEKDKCPIKLEEK